MTPWENIANFERMLSAETCNRLTTKHDGKMYFSPLIESNGVNGVYTCYSYAVFRTYRMQRKGQNAYTGGSRLKIGKSESGFLVAQTAFLSCPYFTQDISPRNLMQIPFPGVNGFFCPNTLEPKRRSASQLALSMAPVLQKKRIPWEDHLASSSFLVISATVSCLKGFGPPGICSKCIQ